MGYRVAVETREVTSRSELVKLRKQGYVPASVSGKRITPVSIAIDEKELRLLLREHVNEVLEMELPEQGLQHVIVQELQRDKLIPGKLLHVDFHQINMNEPIKMTIPIEWVGSAPGVAAGGVLTPLLSELEVRSLPHVIPSVIQVDVGSLEIGDKLLIADITLPSEVECLVDPEAVVVTILHVNKPTEDEQEEMSEEAQEAAGAE